MAHILSERKINGICSDQVVSESFRTLERAPLAGRDAIAYLDLDMIKIHIRDRPPQLGYPAANGSALSQWIPTAQDIDSRCGVVDSDEKVETYDIDSVFPIHDETAVIVPTVPKRYRGIDSATG